MRFDALVLDHPAEHRRTPVGGIRNEPLGGKIKARLDTINHFLGGFHYRRADGGCGFHIKDHAMGRVDQVVRRVGKEDYAAGRRGPV